MKNLTLDKLLIENRKVNYYYTVEQKFEAGIILHGWEVKAIKAGKMQIAEAYVKVIAGEIVLVGSHISPLQYTVNSVFTSATKDQPMKSEKIDPTRTRKLLLHKEEIKKLSGKVARSGYTLVPLNLHLTNGMIKCDIGLAKGKDKADKRASEKESDAKREVSKALKQNGKQNID